MKGRAVGRASILCVAAVFAAAAAPTVDKAPGCLMSEVLSPHSTMEKNLRVLTDQIGGRVTGSAAYERALAWGLAAFRQAGVDSAALEGYPVAFRWEAEAARAEIVAPSRFPLRVASIAFSPSTAGALEAPLLDAGAGKEADFARLGDSAQGSVALVRSKEMASLEDLFTEYLSGPQIMRAAVARGCAAILFMSTRPRDLLYRHWTTWAQVAPIPMAQVAREDGLRLVRLLEQGEALRVSVEVRNRVGGAWEGQNVVAEIRGRELPGEIVLLGAHLDSWDLGTGALDNGVNCALVVEVARALASGPRPRRTVRFVLFTGEEQGLLGSRAYVLRHQAELDRHAAVLIHDIGDGRIRGYFNNGRPDLTPALAAALAPVASSGAGGSNDEALLGTDNFDFLLEGVPNFVADQDTAPYLADYHAESDTFDKVNLPAARWNAAVAAVAVWNLADAPSRPGPRQTRAQIRDVLVRGALDRQMKQYGIWEEWENGSRGRPN